MEAKSFSSKDLHMQLMSQRPQGDAVPGWRAPGTGFDQPFEMLEACHERVQRMLALLARRGHAGAAGGA